MILRPYDAIADERDGPVGDQRSKLGLTAQSGQAR